MDPSDLIQNGLEHHGVKGMHWGVRKARTSLGFPARPAPKRKSASSDDAAKASAAAKKAKISGTHSLSNQELQHLVTRMNLERQFNTLQTSKADSVKKGHNAIKAVLAAGATANATLAFAKSPAGQLIKEKLKTK